MTEQEIIQYLKDNKKNGVAYCFMPDEVQDWVEIHPSTWFSAFFSVGGKTSWKRIGGKNVEFDSTDIIMLPDFKLPSENTSENREWVEFEIDQKSRDFLVKAETENYNDCDKYYYWFEVERFLRDSVDNDRGYTAFGGWQYPNSSYWSTCQQVKQGRGDNYSSYYCEREQGEDYLVDPTIPIKIRFWREKK